MDFKRHPKPPNLRTAEDPNRSCAQCTHFQGPRTCKLYSYQVRPYQTCDSFKARA